MNDLARSETYSCAGIVWRLWVCDRSELPGTERYEWRSSDGRLRVGKRLGRSWAAVGTTKLLADFSSLTEAMHAAKMVGARRTAA